MHGKSNNSEITGDEFSDQTDFLLMHFSFVFIFLNMRYWKSLFRIGINKLWLSHCLPLFLSEVLLEHVRTHSFT